MADGGARLKLTGQLLAFAASALKPQVFNVGTRSRPWRN